MASISVTTSYEENESSETWTHLTLEDTTVPHTIDPTQPLDQSNERHIPPSHTEQFEVLVPEVKEEQSIPRKGYRPLTYDECRSLFDNDGRLVREAKLRKALFEGMYLSLQEHVIHVISLGGIHPSWRHHIWKFLFQIYPFHSTQRYINYYH